VDEKNEQIAHRRIVAEWETKESWAKQQFASHRPAAPTLPSGHKVPVLPSSVSAVMSDPNAGQNSVLNLLDRSGSIECPAASAVELISFSNEAQAQTCSNSILFFLL